MMKHSILKELEYTQVADKLEKPAKPFDDLLIEAVGNDDGAIRDAAYRVLFCDVKDLESARQSLFCAFSAYFKCAEHAQDLIDQEAANADWVSAGRPSAMSEAGHSYRDFG